MKFRDPWIDPRILRVRPTDAQAYLLQHGWKPLGPAESNLELLLFDGPAEGETNPLVALPVHMDQGAEVQRMVELVTELARYEGRYAGDVLSDILRQAGQDQPSSSDGEGKTGSVATTRK